MNTFLDSPIDISEFPGSDADNGAVCMTCNEARPVTLFRQYAGHVLLYFSIALFLRKLTVA
jgi:hypothetical protein